MSKLISMTAAMTCLAITASAGNDTPHWSLTWKKMQTTGPELELIGTLPTRTTHELGASDWSVGCETLDRDYADFDSYKPYLSELGVTSARIQSGWARCEKQKGRYDFAWIDHIVDGMLEEGVQPWINLGYGNPLYGAEKGLGSKIFTDEPTMKAWLKFVETIVARYRDKVHEWEIWNEPNLGENRTNYDAYASLLSHTVETIRRVQPDAVIIGMGLSAWRSIRQGQLLDAVFDVGSWYVLFPGIGLFALGLPVGGWLMGIGLLMLLLTGGRKNKGLGKITGGLGKVYNITGFLSDLLSYSRVMALGLSGAVVGQVVNKIATMATGIPGVILFVAVFLFGHIFNLAISLLGAYVHTSRLQYIEFFGRFFEDGGHPFKPLENNTKFVEIVKED